MSGDPGRLLRIGIPAGFPSLAGILRSMSRQPGGDVC